MAAAIRELAALTRAKPSRMRYHMRTAGEALHHPTPAMTNTTQPSTILATPDSWGERYFLLPDAAAEFVASLSSEDGRYEAGIQWSDGFRVQTVHVVTLAPSGGRVDLIDEEIETRRRVGDHMQPAVA